MRPRIWAAALLFAASAAALLLLVRQATRDDASPFFAHDPPAEWILYPHAPSLAGRPRVELSTLFTREFVLPAAPTRARLRVRLHRTGTLSINGRTLDVSERGGERWKEVREAEVAPLLKAGPNQIEVEVHADFGPPALWLELDCEAMRVASDASWTASLMGAEDAPARLATVPMSRWSRTAVDAAELDARNPRPIDALRARAPQIAGLFAVGGAFALAAAWLVRGKARLSAGATFAAWLVVALAWLALFVHNRELDHTWGFDSTGHFEYITFLLEEGRVPLADDGWQMYQPPLYYGLAAGLLKLAGLTIIDQPAVELIRWLGCFAAVMQALFLLLALRELLPERPGLVLCAFVFGAFLPMQLYIFQFVTNESWVAMLSSAALWWTIRMLRRETSAAWEHAVLGAFLGLAMLAKFSALIPLVLCTSVLFVQRWLAGQRAPAEQARLFGTTLAVVLALCGWHYLRIALHFGGNPFVGDWDEATGFTWWQDPGYRVIDDYLRFGHALERPLLSALASVPDALYSTMWGDGMISGPGFPEIPRPWDPELMAAGYVIALGPCLAMLLGALLAGVDFVRTQRAERFLSLAVLGATLFAMLTLTVRLPFYAQAKAFYGLSALVPLALCFALGLDALAFRVRALAPLGVVWLAGWACVAFATFYSSAERLSMDPIRKLNLMDRGGWIARANGAFSQGRQQDGIEALRRALEVDPDEKRVGPALAQKLQALRAPREGLAAARAALRVTPTDPLLHLLTGALWRTLGNQERAAFHVEAARRLERVQPAR